MRATRPGGSCMRGSPLQQVTMLSTVTPDQLIPAQHPIRRIKPIVDGALRTLEPRLDAMYVETPGFEHSSFSKNRERLLAQDIARQFFAAVLAHAKHHHLLSSQHFSVDGTLLEAWASFK